MATEHSFNPNSLPVTIWGTDAHGNRFTEELKTVRIALRAVELESAHAIAVGEVIGLRYREQESRFKAIESVILRQDTYRLTLADLDGRCLWEAELPLAAGAPTTADERRRSERYDVLGQAMIFQLTGASGIMRPFKLTAIGARGCYIESRTPLPVGTDVSLRLTLSNSMVNATGIVRSSDPGVGMGVEIQRFEPPEDKLRFAQWLIEAQAAAG
jgi:hypothetical protein